VDVVNNELTKTWKEAAVDVRYMEEKKKTTRNSHIRCDSPDPNWAPPAHKSQALPTKRTCSAQESDLGFFSDACRDD
jgi:hypothetical protein